MTSTRTMSFAASLLLACIFATVSLAAENDKSSTDAKAEKGTVHTVEASMD